LDIFAPVFVSAACENYLSSGASAEPKKAMAGEHFGERDNNS
jgi:hypothetical protein